MINAALSILKPNDRAMLGSWNSPIKQKLDAKLQASPFRVTTYSIYQLRSHWNVITAHSLPWSSKQGIYAVCAFSQNSSLQISASLTTSTRVYHWHDIQCLIATITKALSIEHICVWRRTMGEFLLTPASRRFILQVSIKATCGFPYGTACYMACLADIFQVLWYFVEV